MSKFRWMFGFLLLFSIVATPALAQDLSEVWKITPKTGQSAGFEAAVKAHMEFRQANGDTWQWIWGEVVVGEEVGTYYAVSGGHSWADFDSYEAMEQTPMFDAHWGSTVDPLVEDAGNVISRDLPDMSRIPETGAEPTLFQVTNMYLEPEGTMGFYEALGKAKQAMDDAGAPVYWGVSEDVVGGMGPVVTMMTFSVDWAGFADPDPTMEEILVEAYGEEDAMAIFQQFMEGIDHYESMVIRLRLDLSGVEM